MAMTDEAKARAKAKRQALSALRKNLDAAKEAAAQALVNDDAEGLAAAKQKMLDIEAEMDRLSKPHASWQHVAEGQWLRETAINDHWAMQGSVMKRDEGFTGRVVLTYGSNGVVTASLANADEDKAKKQVSLLMTAMRQCAKV